MSDLFYNLLGFAAVCGAGCVCVVAGVALAALVVGVVNLLREHKEDEHET